MSIENLRAALPGHAKDLRLNLGSLAATPGLTPAQLWGAAYASALATREPGVIRAAAGEAALHLDRSTLDAVEGCAMVLSMNNVYYRFVHLVGPSDYGQMPARLRMNLLASPGVDKLDFELWSIAVSAVNGCGMCLAAHDASVLKLGASREMVQNVVRVAAIMASAAVACAGRDALAALPSAA